MGNAGTLLSRRYWHIILPSFFISVLAFLDRTNVSYAALTMNKDLGFTAEIFGMGAGIFFAGYLLFEIPGALIANKYSPRWWLARIMFSWGFVCALMGTMTTVTEFYVYRFLMGAAEASLYPVLYAVVIPRWFSAEERPQAISIMLTSILVAPIIGSPLAGFLIDSPMFGLKGWQVLYIIEGIPAIIFGFLLIYFLPDWPKDATWLSDEEKKMLTEQFEKEVALKDSVKKYSIREALLDPQILKLCAIYFLWITGFWGFNVWMPTVLKSISGWSNTALGMIIVIPMLLATIGFIVVGRSSTRTGEKRWHIALPLFIGTIGMGIGSFVTDPMVSLALVCLSAIGCYAGMGVWWSVPTSFLSGAAAAGAVGLINSIGNIGGWVGPYVTGYIKDLTGSFQWAYVFLACSLLAGGLLMLTMKVTQPVDGKLSAETIKQNQSKSS